MRSESLLTEPGLHRDPISSRAGFLPICLSHLPVRALADIPVYLRSHGGEKGHTGAAGNTFALFRAKHLCFDDDCRRRLLGHNVRFVYIPIAFHEKFRRQTEAQIQEMVDDPAMAASAKWEIVYETSTELANELLSQPNFAARVPRLQAVSKAVSTLVLNDPLAFSHLFAASHHDFYTATHMINVATWMVAPAYALGHVDEAELSLVFQAGMVHDVGKTLVPREILNKTGQLTPAEWATLRSHPELGCRYLKDAGVVDPLILDVTLQHHERLDGSGYPSGLTGEQVPPMSRVCAVVDTFDALTALRPFKSQALSVAEAMQVIFHDTPARYDPNVVETWTDLIRTVEADIEMPAREVKNGAAPEIRSCLIQLPGPGQVEKGQRRNGKWAADRGGGSERITGRHRNVDASATRARTGGHAPLAAASPCAHYQRIRSRLRPLPRLRRWVVRSRDGIRLAMPQRVNHLSQAASHVRAIRRIDAGGEDVAAAVEVDLMSDRAIRLMSTGYRARTSLHRAR